MLLNASVLDSHVMPRFVLRCVHTWIAKVNAGGTIDIFDGGVRPTHELGMEYNLPFTGGDGKAYSLRGVKHMPSTDCLGILTQVRVIYLLA